MLENAQGSTIFSRFYCHTKQESARAVQAPSALAVEFLLATTDDAAILSVTGKKGAAFLNHSPKIQEDWTPEAAAEEIISELQALFARHNAVATS